MKALLEHVVTSIVDHPESVQIEERKEGRTIRLRLFVHPNDIGKVIGKHGQTANAIRSILSAAAPAERVRLDIIDA